MYKLLASIVCGIIAAVLMMYIAWEHNLQCEIRCEGYIDWEDWSLVGVSWFIPVFVSVYVLLWVISRIKNT